MTATITKEGEAGIQQYPSNIIGIPTEIYPNEARVAATPDTVKKLQKLGFDIVVQSGAGEAANFTDEAYQKAGCRIIPDAHNICLFPQTMSIRN